MPPAEGLVCVARAASAELASQLRVGGQTVHDPGELLDELSLRARTHQETATFRGVFGGSAPVRRHHGDAQARHDLAVFPALAGPRAGEGVADAAAELQRLVLLDDAGGAFEIDSGDG